MLSFRTSVIYIRGHPDLLLLLFKSHHFLLFSYLPLLPIDKYIWFFCFLFLCVFPLLSADIFHMCSLDFSDAIDKCVTLNVIEASISAVFQTMYNTCDNTREASQGHQSKKCPGIFNIHMKHLFLINAWNFIDLLQTYEPVLWGFEHIVSGKQVSAYVIRKLYNDYGSTWIIFSGNTGLGQPCILLIHFSCIMVPQAFEKQLR